VQNPNADGESIGTPERPNAYAQSTSKIRRCRRLIEEARRELKIIQQGEFPPVVTEDSSTVNAAADELWTWYQQWAEIARVAISNRRTRITLGITSPRTSTSEDGEASN